jgi:hypothetical protein
VKLTLKFSSCTAFVFSFGSAAFGIILNSRFVY